MSDAILALRNARVDAAVLDVNLGGEVVYPLADVLTADRVPFIFVTGYGPDEIERRFASVPVLQKPIEPDALQSIFVRRPPVPELHASAERRSMAN
jgi:two-component SAPR family response regulator